MAIVKIHATSVASGVSRIRRYAIILAVFWTVVFAGFVWWYCRQEPELEAFSRKMIGFYLANGFTWLVGLGVIRFGANNLTRNTSALETNAGKFQSIVNNVREVIFQTDATGDWLFLNPAWSEITGHSVEESIGRNCTEFQHPDDRPAALHDFRALVSGDKDFCRREIRFMAEDGGTCWLQANARPAVDAMGAVVGVSGTLVDITERKRAEEALSRSEQLLREAQEVAQIGWYVYEIDMNTWECSKMLGTIFGIGDDYVRDLDHWLELIAPHDREDMKVYLSWVIDSGERFNKDYRIIRPIDGAERWVSGLGEVERDPDGVPVRMIGTVQDISERRRAEKSLRENEKLLSTIIDSEPECVKLMAADGSLLMINRAGLEMIQAESFDQMQGKSVFQLINLPYREAFKALTEEVFQGKQGNLVFEMTGIHGRHLWLDTHAVPMRNEQGEIVSLLGITRDITEHKQAEDALRESEEHVRQIFDQTNDAIVLFRMDTFKIFDANPAALKLFEITREELDQTKPWAFITPQVFRDFIRAIPVGDTSLDFALDKATCLKKGGTKIIVSIRGKILKLKDDYVIFCSIRDISERVRLEGEISSTQAKLIHTNKMTSLGMLVSGISHEINNPNHYISVNASMLADVWRDAAPILQRFHDENGNFSIGGLPFTEMQELAPRLFNGIAEGSRRINAIVTDMRDFVKEDKSGLQGIVDVNRLISNAESILWHHIHKHTDNFHAELQTDLPAARGNGQQLEQVIINLIMNSLQALPGKEAAVFVTTAIEPTRGDLVITVRDEGKGMRKNVLARLREPFFTTKLSEGGTGLGLYIADSIIKEHKGSLEFKSTLGRGTTATIRIPVA